MSQLSRAIVGAAAISLTVGAVQLASGRDLKDLQPARFVPSSQADNMINRAAKSDRIVGVLAAVSQTQTVAFRSNGLPETSILIRIPVSVNAERDVRSGPAAPSFIKSGDRKMAVACEPSVSVLTEVARHLQPGRCVT